MAEKRRARLGHLDRECLMHASGPCLLMIQQGGNLVVNSPELEPACCAASG